MTKKCEKTLEKIHWTKKIACEDCKLINGRNNSNQLYIQNTREKASELFSPCWNTQKHSRTVQLNAWVFERTERKHDLTWNIRVMHGFQSQMGIELSCCFPTHTHTHLNYHFLSPPLHTYWSMISCVCIPHKDMQALAVAQVAHVHGYTLCVYTKYTYTHIGNYTSVYR